MDPVTTLTQVCINTPENIVGLIALIVAGTSALANLVKSPDAYTNPAMKLLSRVIHFIAADIVTAVK